MSNPEVERSIEAILMVVDEPVSEVVLAQIIETPTEQILESLHNLQNRYENDFRGYDVSDYNYFEALFIYYLII